MNNLLLIDLDRTLFDTDKFWSDFALCLGDFSGIKAKNIFDDYEQYVAGRDKFRYIDYDGLLQRHEIDAKLFEKHVRKRMANMQYLYDDAVLLLNNISNIKPDIEIAILTFGQDSFQNLKISMSPALHKYLAFITLLPKNEFIQYYLADRSGYLIDDKPNQKLPTGWVEIHLDRSAKITVSKLADHNWRINNLEEVRGILNENTTN